MRAIGITLTSLAIILAGCAGAGHIVLDRQSATPDDLEAQLEVQVGIDRVPPVAGNRVTLLSDGRETFPAMFAAIKGARDSINLEYYTFDDVRSGGTTLGDLLVDRLGHGVAVSVIYDAYGSSATPAAFLDRLRQAGATLTVFNANPLARGQFDSPNSRDHRKIMVIDGQIAFIGGINLDHVYENPPTFGTALGNASQAYWRDTDARIAGPVVADLQRVFFATWADQKGGPLPARNWFPVIVPQGQQTVRILASKPVDGQPLYYASLVRAIHFARHNIGLSTGYFVPTHQEREELARAARRGVQVRLILPGSSDSDDSLAAGRAAYGDLLAAGVKIYEVQHAVLHSKFVAIDGVWLAIGSSNIDRRSVVYNNEVDAVVLGPRTADANGILDRDVAHSHQIDMRTWESRPMAERLHESRVRVWQFLL